MRAPRQTITIRLFRGLAGNRVGGGSKFDELLDQN
jgi:hypothetical protein